MSQIIETTATEAKDLFFITPHWRPEDKDREGFGCHLIWVEGCTNKEDAEAGGRELLGDVPFGIIVGQTEPQASKEIRLKFIADVRKGMAEADFWIQRQGQLDGLGRVGRTFNSNWWGIKVRDTDTTSPDWLRHVFEMLHGQGWWKQYGHGTTVQGLRKKDVQNVRFSLPENTARPNVRFVEREGMNLPLALTANGDPALAPAVGDEVPGGSDPVLDNGASGGA